MLTLNVLSPVLILTVGGGLVLGSLIKNVPIKSPNVSATNLTSVTVAVAPLSAPTRLIPVVTYPKYVPWALADRERVSTFSVVPDAEYWVEKDSDVLYGFALYVIVGAL